MSVDLEDIVYEALSEPRTATELLRKVQESVPDALPAAVFVATKALIDLEKVRFDKTDTRQVFHPDGSFSRLGTFKRRQ